MKAAKEYTEGREAAAKFTAAMTTLFQAKKTASSAKPKAAKRAKPKKG
ncbi:MAG TPA: hypothetical protein VGL89_03270 [Candidatus Koribacter sp.]|jgi:hypothetical protein